jgi:hypothetical protein
LKKTDRPPRQFVFSAISRFFPVFSGFFLCSCFICPLTAGMPVGDFELTAVTASGRTGRALGRINTDNESVTVNIVVASA